MFSYVVESMTTEERQDGARPFVTIKADYPAGDDGNFTFPMFFLNPATALTVGRELIAHAKRCGAVDEETKDTP